MRKSSHQNDRKHWTFQNREGTQGLVGAGGDPKDPRLAGSTGPEDLTEAGMEPTIERGRQAATLNVHFKAPGYQVYHIGGRPELGRAAVGGSALTDQNLGTIKSHSIQEASISASSRMGEPPGDAITQLQPYPYQIRTPGAAIIGYTGRRFNAGNVRAGGEYVQAAALDSSESRRENRDLDQHDQHALTFKDTTDALNSEHGDRGKPSRGAPWGSRGSDINYSAASATLGRRQTGRPAVQNLDPHVINREPHIVITSFPVKASSQLRTALSKTKSGKRGTAPDTDRERARIAGESRKHGLPAQQQATELSMGKLRMEPEQTGAAPGRVLPPVLMDLLPDEQGECHLERVASGKRNSLILAGTRSTLLQDKHQIHQMRGRHTELREQPPKWRWEEGQMRLNSTGTTMPREL